MSNTKLTAASRVKERRPQIAGRVFGRGNHHGRPAIVGGFRSRFLVALLENLQRRAGLIGGHAGLERPTTRRKLTPRISRSWVSPGN